MCIYRVFIHYDYNVLNGKYTQPLIRTCTGRCRKVWRVSVIRPSQLCPRPEGIEHTSHMHKFACFFHSLSFISLNSQFFTVAGLTTTGLLYHMSKADPLPRILPDFTTGFLSQTVQCTYNVFVVKQPVVSM